MMKIPSLIIGLTLIIIVILFVLEFVLFPPLSAQIKHGTYTYQDNIDDYFDNQSSNPNIGQYTNEQYKSTSIKAIRENPEEYIGQKISITGQLKSTIFNDVYHCESGFLEVAIFDKNDYRIYLDKQYNKYHLSEQINAKGDLVHPNPFERGPGVKCMVTMKGEIKYIQVKTAGTGSQTPIKLLVIVPREIIYDGLTWTIHTPTPTPTTIPTQQGVTILV